MYPLFVSNSVKLALKVKAEGLYIPAFNKRQVFSNLENKRFFIIGSAHTQKEVQDKILQGCKAIFLSPIFKVSKAKKYLGINKFNIITLNKNIKFFALGGINKKNYHKLKMVNLKGFGGVTFFKKKTGLLKAGFPKRINSFKIT